MNKLKTFIYFILPLFSEKKKNQLVQDAWRILDPYEYHVCLCTKWCLSSRLTILCGKQNTTTTTTKPVMLDFTDTLFILTNFVIPGMLIGSVDCYHLYHFSLTLILAGGHKVSAKQNFLASFFHTCFNWSEWNLVWCWNSSSCTSWCYCWIWFNKTRELAPVLLIA